MQKNRGTKVGVLAQTPFRFFYFLFKFSLVFYYIFNGILGRKHQISQVMGT
jgi:NADH:ubiquinone oxidoreductase subunit 4 (subunit M)